MLAFILGSNSTILWLNRFNFHINFDKNVNNVINFTFSEYGIRLIFKYGKINGEGAPMRQMLNGPSIILSVLHDLLVTLYNC